MVSFDCSICGHKCHTHGGLSHHKAARHPIFPTPDESTRYKRIRHQFLDAHPCTKDGAFLNEADLQIPSPIQADHSESPWGPFQNLLEFDWAYYHYVRLQSSKSEILEGLDLWRATVIKHSSEQPTANAVPWRNADDLYKTIDCIQDEQQLDTPAFHGEVDYAPYMEFNANGDRIYSNFMSGHWVSREADKIAHDPTTHGSMLVPVIAGSDKTTVSVATGHQEYHPVYISPGIISNTARRGHGNGVLPVAFLPIPKTSKRQRKRPEFQRFCRQLYHRCLETIFELIKPYMETYKVVKCPDGHYRRAIFSLGPYIADYPEQVWLGGTVLNWCPKCDARPDDLDSPGSHHRSHEKTDYLIKNFDPGILWDEYGIWHDIVPFTHGFPHADIHELLAPDLLHQLIKGVFKDHLVTWLLLGGLTITQFSISAVPPYAGLHRFPDGQDYNQWTGDDSKALIMKVYLAAIAGYLPSSMVQCLATFMDTCYIARRNAITGPALQHFQSCVEKFHALRNIFIESGVRTSISLPRQHALDHYVYAIQLFGSPNGLCSSITESKHIKAMLRTLVRMDKMEALRRKLTKLGMLAGTTSSYMAQTKTEQSDIDISDTDGELMPVMPPVDDEDDDGGPVSGIATDAMSDIKLAARSQPRYPRNLHQLAAYIHQPSFPLALQRFLFTLNHGDNQPPPDLGALPSFKGEIRVYHSAIATFYAPSDLCGAGGLHREHIRSTPSFHGSEHRDTVFVVLDESKAGMEGMEIGRVLLFFSFHYRQKDYACALINWYVHDDEPDRDTGMWTVQWSVIKKDSPLSKSSTLIPLREEHISFRFMDLLQFPMILVTTMPWIASTLSSLTILSTTMRTNL
ncbi:hypothetical protein M413DRAFT_31879 [Hebeloma cylindrosporum]|uniref:C2H2-type domain-containing protein n=1 Tax=Hebeloma cylindrosporum TaxID=76867 RepID=A0A0C3BHF7_HEBCY|nr:hypothetical protein M413DRAFT_31879 [Hebeloma cylindrosporum h7]